MTNAYVVSGVLGNAGTIHLNEPLPITSGEVRVTVEVIGPSKPKPTFQEVMEKVWADQKARGHVPPTTEEVAERIREAREGWDE